MQARDNNVRRRVQNEDACSELPDLKLRRRTAALRVSLVLPVNMYSS